MKKYIVYDTTGNPVGVPFNTWKDAETYKIVCGRLDWTVKLAHIHIDRKSTEKQRRAVSGKRPFGELYHFLCILRKEPKC